MWPPEFGGTPPRDCDAFHDLIWTDELARCASGGKCRSKGVDDANLETSVGLLWAVFFGFGIALPPILSFGSQYLKDKVWC